MVNLGCIDLNPWYARCDDVDRPDYLHFDLDPVPGAAFAQVRETALVVREALDGLGMPSYRQDDRLAAASTSTCRSCAGPTQKEVWTFAKAIALALEPPAPALITAEYRDRQAAGRARARRLQPERLGPHARLGLLGAPAPAGDRVDAGDLGGGRARRRRSRTSASTTCPRACASVGDLWKPLLSARGRFRLDRLG